MRAWDTLTVAMAGLARHWVRATLNGVGILAGVASVVLLIAVATSVGRAANSQVAGLGANLVVVYPSGVSSSGVQSGIGTSSSLTSDDVAALGNPGYVPDGIASVPTVAVRDNVTALARTWQTDVLGSTEQFAGSLGYTMSEGRFFDSTEVRGAASVAVIGQTVVENLFAGVDPVGQFVRINDHPFKITGVFAGRGYSGSYNQDDLALIPLQTAYSYVVPTSAARIQQIFVQATSPNATARVKQQVTATLLQRHHISNPALADFQAKTDQDLLATAQRVGHVLTWLLGATAAISLISGALAITSLMLGSVRERRREIGIRRAVGAPRWAILAQFLVEAVALAGIGGLAGVAFGFGAASVVGQVVTDIPAPNVTLPAVVIAIAVSLAVGVGAGIYPAIRAAWLQPGRAVVPG